MIYNPKQQMEIQQENEPPFVPEKVFEVGNVYSEDEITLADMVAGKLEPSIHHAVIHYIYNGKEFKKHYRKGVWARGTNDMPRFRVTEFLSDS